MSEDDGSENCLGLLDTMAIQIRVPECQGWPPQDGRRVSRVSPWCWDGVSDVSEEHPLQLFSICSARLSSNLTGVANVKGDPLVSGCQTSALGLEMGSWMWVRSTHCSYCARVLTLGEVGELLEAFLASPCVATFENPCGGYVTVKYWCSPHKYWVKWSLVRLASEYLSAWGAIKAMSDVDVRGLSVSDVRINFPMTTDVPSKLSSVSTLSYRVTNEDWWFEFPGISAFSGSDGGLEDCESAGIASFLVKSTSHD